MVVPSRKDLCNRQHLQGPGKGYFREETWSVPECRQGSPSLALLAHAFLTLQLLPHVAVSVVVVVTLPGCPSLHSGDVISSVSVCAL